MLKKPGLWIFLFLIVLQIQPSRAEIKWVDSFQVVYPEQDAVFDSFPVQFIWNKHPNFSKYNLEISVDSLFRNGWPCWITISDTTFVLTSDNASCPVVPGFRYYWRIWYSSDDSGNYKLFKSAAHRFTILNENPNKPSLFEPHREAHVDSTNIRFSWSSIKISVGYRLRIQGPAIILDTVIHDTVYVKDHLNPQGYYVTVAAIDSNQNETWSQLTTFSVTIKDPGPPTLLIPPDSNIVITRDIVFTWLPDANGFRNIKYRLLVFKDSGALSLSSKLVMDTAGLTETFFYYTELESNTRYYWNCMYYGELGHPRHTTSSYYTFTTNSYGVVERFKKLDFDITPNPVSQKTIISLPSTAGAVRIFVTDILGHRVKTINDAAGQKITLDLSDLSDGVYFLGVEGNGFIERKKIVKF